MSSSYFILRMLRKNKSKTKPHKKEILRQLKQSETVEDIKNIKCRICLKDGMIPVYGEEFRSHLPDAIRTIGGVEMAENDNLPKYLCETCHSLLQGAVIFRKSAQESDQILRRTLINNPTSPALTDNDNYFGISDETILENDNEYKRNTSKRKTSKQYTTQRNSKKNKNVRIQCQLCHRLLTSQLYDKHVKRHQSASHLLCDICGKLYRKDNLIRHLQLHSNDLPFQCQICPYRGRFMESLKIHMRTHSGDKPFSCDNCDLRFITKSNLNRHLLTHKKEKPFSCAECCRGFYTQRDLEIHLKADHGGYKEFGCRLCGNKYSSKKALMRHEVRVHKREKMARGRMPLYLQVEFQNNNFTL